VTRARFALLVFVVASAFAKSPAPEVIFISPCECQGFHGKHRWIAKTDLTPVPLDKSAIQSVTPSQIYAWEGLAPDVDLASMVEARMPSEEKWYALTGRIVDAKVEADGDIDIALEDATGNRRCHRRVGAKVLTNLCQEWLRKFLEFLLSDRDRSRRWPQ
jgi:hypothetical protein